MIGHRISLSKIKKIEFIPSIFSHHNDIKRNINKQENWETHKVIHTPEQLVGQRRKQISTIS